LALCGVFAIGCGGGVEPPPPVVTPAPALAVATCSGAWQTVRADAPYPPPKALAFGADQIAFNTRIEAGTFAIQTISTVDGTERTVVKDTAYSLWAERDTVLYTRYRQLFSVPMSGGEPTLLVDFTDPTGHNDFSFTQVLDASFLYWMDLNDFSLSRIPRAGGAVQTFGAPSSQILDGIAVGADAIVAASGEKGFAVPLGSGAARTLADTAGGDFAGVDASGAYFSRTTPSAKIPVEKYELVRAPADGGALETILTPPDHIMPDRIWPDGQGGFMMTSLGTFDDGKLHEGVWFVSATGESRLAACDPMEGHDTAYIVARPAFTSDAVYLVAQKVDQALWSLVKIAR
jgi:hypothetical protein